MHKPKYEGLTPFIRPDPVYPPAHRREAGARGDAPTLYFNDPSKHLLEIRSYGR
jgi:hypothetical protein